MATALHKPESEPETSLPSSDEKISSLLQKTKAVDDALHSTPKLRDFLGDMKQKAIVRVFQQLLKTRLCFAIGLDTRRCGYSICPYTEAHDMTVLRSCECFQVRYCSEECQKKGWLTHKPACDKERESKYKAAISSRASAPLPKPELGIRPNLDFVEAEALQRRNVLTRILENSTLRVLMAWHLRLYSGVKEDDDFLQYIRTRHFVFAIDWMKYDGDWAIPQIETFEVSRSIEPPSDSSPKSNLALITLKHYRTEADPTSSLLSYLPAMKLDFINPEPFGRHFQLGKVIQELNRNDAYLM